MNQTLMKQSQHEHAKRKLETLKQQDLRDVVARRSSLGFPTHQERTKVFLLTSIIASADYDTVMQLY